jgi:hypothetical protein
MLDLQQETTAEIASPIIADLETCPEMTLYDRQCPTTAKYKPRVGGSHSWRLHAWTCDRTVGGAFSTRYVSLYVDHADLLTQAWSTVRRTEDPDVARRARELLSTIQETIAPFGQLRAGLERFPPLWASNVDDGSVLIEWIFSDFRIAFSIEPDAKESSWYLVSNENLGGVRALGYTSDVDMRMLILWLFGFARANFQDVLPR